VADSDEQRYEPRRCDEEQRHEQQFGWRREAGADVEAHARRERISDRERNRRADVRVDPAVQDRQDRARARERERSAPLDASLAPSERCRLPFTRLIEQLLDRRRQRARGVEARKLHRTRPLSPYLLISR
jgi:hypothetical protein